MDQQQITCPACLRELCIAITGAGIVVKHTFQYGCKYEHANQLQHLEKMPSAVQGYQWTDDQAKNIKMAINQNHYKMEYYCPNCKHTSTEWIEKGKYRPDSIICHNCKCSTDGWKFLHR